MRATARTVALALHVGWRKWTLLWMVALCMITSLLQMGFISVRGTYSGQPAFYVYLGRQLRIPPEGPRTLPPYVLVWKGRADMTLVPADPIRGPIVFYMLPAWCAYLSSKITYDRYAEIRWRTPALALLGLSVASVTPLMLLVMLVSWRVENGLGGPWLILAALHAVIGVSVGVWFRAARLTAGAVVLLVMVIWTALVLSLLRPGSILNADASLLAASCATAILAALLGRPAFVDALWRESQ
jgi:hypothetical protein